MKFLVTIIMCLALTACGVTSGSWTKRPVLNADGEMVTNILGFPVYEKIRISQHAAIAQAGAQAFSNSSKSEPAPPCGFLKPDQIASLSASGQVEYFRAIGDCERSRSTTQLVAAALGRPMSDGDAITRNYANIVKSIEDGKSRRFQSGITGFASLGTSYVIGSAVKAGFDATRDVGIAAAENAGDMTVGDISLSSSQHSSSDANTGGAASAAEGSATGGNGSGMASNDRSDPSPTIITIGDNNASGVTSGAENRTFVDTRATQQLESSANGAANFDSNVDQQPVIDDNQGDQSNQPENGSGNSIL